MTHCGRGLQTAAWVSVDDTGARHAAKNGFCTQIGNDDFALVRHPNEQEPVELPGSPARRAYLDYVINQAALDYMRGRDLAGPVISQLAAHQQTRFADQAAWQSHLDQLAASACNAGHPWTQSASPPKGRCGAKASRPMGCCARW